jgi:hypothetical protein
MAIKMQHAWEGPANLNPDGSVPNTRMGHPGDVVNRVMTFKEADEKTRSRKRSLVRGLVDGNPPYKAAQLKEVGRKDACNVNWRIAESMFNMASGAFYDVLSEVPMPARIRVKAKNPRDADKWSKIVSEEYGKTLKRDRSWDYQMQLSQNEMVLHGAGPVFFEDETTWLNKAAKHGDVLVPNFALSDVTCWEECAKLVTYQTHELYFYIRNASAAQKAGWNVEAAKNAIMTANKHTKDGGMYKTWEWHQEKLKTGSYNHTAQSDEIAAAHYYFREFPKKGEEEGRISHTIVLMDEGEGGKNFLFNKIGRFSKWEELVHPLYYDNTGGGFHYGVTGMGVRMYAGMEYQNRLLCKIAEDVFAPKIMFRPTTANADQTLAIAKMGPWAKLPPGYDMQQATVPGLIEDSVVFNRELTGIMGANLAQFRQNLQTKEGNPITAREADIRAQEQARLGKTQLARYYTQLDWLHAEKYRRLVNVKVSARGKGGRARADFLSRCQARGVPLSAMRNVESVEAVRVAGQGSQQLRQQILERILGIVTMLPQGGQRYLVEDYISALAGQQATERYVPEIGEPPNQDHVTAALQLAAMKDGVKPVVTEEQDHEIFAQIFLEGAAQAAASVQQARGANAQEVLAFLEIAGPAIAQRLALISENPAKEARVKAMTEQFNQLAKFTDKLRDQVASAMSAAAQRNGELAGMLSAEQLAAAKQQREQARKDADLGADIQRKQTKLGVDIAAKQAKTAQAIASQRAKQ